MAKSNTRIFTVCIGALVVLLGVVLFSAGAAHFPGTSPPQQNNSHQAKPKKDPLLQKIQEIDARFPLTDYDAPDPTNAEGKAKRWKKNKHYDDGGMVMKNPSDEGSASVLVSESFFALPALPAARSDVILTADVLKSEAHLSNDKTGIYSEFCVQVNEVLKNAASTLSQSNLITLSRRGGKVRYPSGHVERYEIMTQNMPAIGKRYLFFLKAIPDTEDYEIMTGYDIGSTRVEPLDDSAQFDPFRGKDVAGFIQTVRDEIAKN
ncbi:MAG TPA: hypothetical protein VNG71_02680 [Pyrinomonadaceae bacterium]|nr:hypothetical protein [Pyrinomonadaceae bacterium]